MASVAILALLLLSGVRAQWSSSSSSISSSSGESSIVTNTTDVCNQDEYSNDCWYPVPCKTCLARTGCAVEVSTGRCVSSSSTPAPLSESPSDLSSALYLLSGEVKYCGAIDPACFTCRRANAPEVCLGSRNCVCVAQCELISSQPTKCLPDGSMGYTSLIAAAAVLFPLIAYLLFRGSPCAARCSLRRLLQRHRRAKNRPSLPAGLKLDAWRNHLAERPDPVDEQLTDLELRSCFVPMNSVRRQPPPRTETGEHPRVEEEAAVEEAASLSRAVAATDLPLAATAGHREAAQGEREVSGAELV